MDGFASAVRMEERLAESRKSEPGKGWRSTAGAIATSGCQEIGVPACSSENPDSPFSTAGRGGTDTGGTIDRGVCGGGMTPA